MLQKHSLALYSVAEKKIGPDSIVEILIDKEGMTHEVLEPIHLEILDEVNDLLPDNYLLEVSTLGIERPLNSLEEVIENIGSYVYVESQKFSGQAYLEAVDEERLSLSYFLKGQPKKIQVQYQEIKFIRKAIKF